MEISIIIPFTPREVQINDLLDDLQSIPDSDLLLIGESDLIIPNKFKGCFFKAPLNRAIQLNHGAKYAKGKFLWFLHADSRIKKLDLEIFLNTYKNYPNDLHYFDLKFLGPFKKLKLNEMGAKFRSDYLKLPFGDQGLVVSKNIFKKIGGFPLVPLGEDLLFVKSVRRSGVKIRNCGAKIYTSPRKYEKDGWLRTTFFHIFHSIRLSFTK